MAEDQHRRRFLARATSGMVWLSTASALATLTACGGGGRDAPEDGGGNAGGGGGGPLVDPAARAATLQSVRDAVSTLAGGAASFDSAALAAALRTLPALAEVGISTRLGNVWARFTDGQWLVVPNALEPTPALATARTAVAAGALRRHALAAADLDTPSLLVGQQYRQLDMLGAVPTDGSVEAAHLSQNWVDADTLPTLRRMAVGRGFNLPGVQVEAPPDSGLDNGIDGLRDVSGDGIFFLTAQCAQVGPDTAPRTYLGVRTAATDANRARLADELARGVIAHAVQLVGVDGQWHAVEGFAIAPEFPALNGWRFPDRCIAILNLAGAPALDDWLPGLLQAGLRHVLTWDTPMPWPRMLAFADDLVQLNLATNRLDGSFVRQASVPPLRSYGMGETVQHLIDRGLAGAGSLGGLSYLQSGQAALLVNTWLPTVDYVTFDEARGLMELVGQFGLPVDGEPGFSAAAPHPTRTQPAQLLFGEQGLDRFPEPTLARAADPVLRGTASRSRPDWLGGLLQLPVAEEELARGGYVQVLNGGRSSNAVPVTHWEIPVQMMTTVDALTLDCTVSLRLRADVHDWRLTPDGAARDADRDPVGKMALTGSVHSAMHFSASGSISHYDSQTRTRTTVTWLGAGGAANVHGNFAVGFSAMLRWSTRGLELVNLTLRDVAGFRQTTLVERFDANGDLLSRQESEQTVPVALAGTMAPGPGGALAMAFDERWRLSPGRFELTPVPSTVLPVSPLLMQRTVLSWPEVLPDFAPQDDYGGC